MGTMMVEKVVEKVGSIECQLCIYVAELVGNEIKNNKTDEDIVAGLKLVCNVFPADLKDQVYKV